MLVSCVVKLCASLLGLFSSRFKNALWGGFTQEYSINTPILINAAEKQIVENCSITINASVTVLGKLVFRNCTLRSSSGVVIVYGVLKTEKCKTFVNSQFLQIKDGGVYQLDLAEFNNDEIEFNEVISLDPKGKLCWISKRPSTMRRFDDTIMSCVSKNYGLEQDVIYSEKGIDDFSDEKLSAWKEARKVAIYLKRKIIDIPFYRINEFNYPTYLTGDIVDAVEKQIVDGDLTLWKTIAEILSEICKAVYKDDIFDEETYPYRD